GVKQLRVRHPLAFAAVAAHVAVVLDQQAEAGAGDRPRPREHEQVGGLAVAASGEGRGRRHGKEESAPHGAQTATTAPPRRGSPPPAGGLPCTAWTPPKNMLRSRNRATVCPVRSTSSRSIPGSA